MRTNWERERGRERNLMFLHLWCFCSYSLTWSYSLTCSYSLPRIAAASVSFRVTARRVPELRRQPTRLRHLLTRLRRLPTTTLPATRMFSEICVFSIFCSEFRKTCYPTISMGNLQNLGSSTQSYFCFFERLLFYLCVSFIYGRQWQEGHKANGAFNGSNRIRWMSRIMDMHVTKNERATGLPGYSLD